MSEWDDKVVPIGITSASITMVAKTVGGQEVTIEFPLVKFQPNAVKIIESGVAYKATSMKIDRHTLSARLVFDGEIFISNRGRPLWTMRMNDADGHG